MGYALLEGKIYRKAQKITGAGKPGLEQMRPRPPVKVLVIEATTQPHLGPVPSINELQPLLPFKKQSPGRESTVEQDELICFLLSGRFH